ncbi:MAG: DUF4956 domain-containing protein [Lachnospiraceae bacterium]|nr:DUF4956 domain-containing protein [Lachnospiraceae bacterium]
MLDSILTTADSSAITLTTQGMLACSLASVLLGLAIAVCYMICSEKYTKNFVITLAILPILVQAVIMLVNGNLGVGVAILGAFSLVRFRSIAGTSREIGAVFFSMAIGLATGMGYIGYGVIITAIVALLMILLSKTPFGEKKEIGKQLKVTIPENLNYMGMFDDIFEKYVNDVKLEKVKTTNLGSMFELTYLIGLKDEALEKEMIDEIRTRNGNLTITCGQISKPMEEL